MDTRPLELELAQQYKYKPLSKELSNKYRTIYLENIPQFLKENNQPLYTVNKTLICNSFERIVIGDYGAFVEFSSQQANKNSFIIAPGQEYRLYDKKYSDNVKYIWLTIDDDSNIKIYYQKKTVKYADYLPKKYYVSVHEVYI